MTDRANLAMLTSQIAAGFVVNNHVSHHDIGNAIKAIYSALALLEVPAKAEAQPEFVPAVTIRKSLANPAKIISMIDGKPYSVLKRHLTTQGLTPDEYRARYNLPADYPMTAPAYSARRKALAITIGLGRTNTSQRKRDVATSGDNATVSPTKAPRKARAPGGKGALSKGSEHAE